MRVRRGRRPAAVQAAALAVAVLLGGAAACAEDSSPGEAKISDSDADALGGQAVVDELESLYKQATDDGDRTVVVYGPGEKDREPVYKAFTKRFPGIKVQGEYLFGPQLTSKLDQEFASGKHVADIVHTGDTTTVALAGKDRFQAFDPVSAKDLPAQYADPQHRFAAASMLAFGIAYNNEELSEDEAPKGWNDLLDSKFKGKLVSEDVTHAGGSANTLAHMLYDGRYDEDWLQKLADQDLQLVQNTPTAGTSVATGEYDIAAIYAYSFYLRDKKKGAPISFVFPVEGGNHLSGHYLAMVQDAPHPTAAKLLMTWLFTPEGQEEIAKVGQYPTMPGSPAPDEYPALEDIDLLKPVPFDEVNALTGKSLGVLKKLFG